MKSGILSYDGGTYELEPDTLRDLLDRGVIVAGDSPGHYLLALEHVIDEVEPMATVLDRLTGSRARTQGIDGRSVSVGLHAPNGFGGRR